MFPGVFVSRFHCIWFYNHFTQLRSRLRFKILSTTKVFQDHFTRPNHNRYIYWGGAGIRIGFSFQSQTDNFSKGLKFFVINQSLDWPFQQIFQYCVFRGLTFLALGLKLLQTYQSFDRKFYSPKAEHWRSISLSVSLIDPIQRCLLLRICIALLQIWVQNARRSTKFKIEYVSYICKIYIIIKSMFPPKNLTTFRSLLVSISKN